MKARYTALILFIVILGTLLTGYLIGAGVVNVPYITKGSNSTTISSTLCTTSGETNGVEIQIVKDNYSSNPPGVIPVSGASVAGSDMYYCGGLQSKGAFTPSTTNSSGWTSLLFGGSGIYYLTINYQSPLNYTVSVPTAPLATTYAIYNISSRNLTVNTCYYGEHC